MKPCESFDRNIVSMSIMLMRLGIDLTKFERQGTAAEFAAAVRACQACPSGEVCRDWLACTGDRIGRVPAFCPNAERFEDVRRATEVV